MQMNVRYQQANEWNGCLPFGSEIFNMTIKLMLNGFYISFVIFIHVKMIDNGTIDILIKQQRLFRGRHCNQCRMLAESVHRVGNTSGSTHTVTEKEVEV
jgi:hypothetical protein